VTSGDLDADAVGADLSSKRSNSMNAADTVSADASGPKPTAGLA
jgi:hypothetical protein